MWKVWHWVFGIGWVVFSYFMFGEEPPPPPPDDVECVAYTDGSEPDWECDEDEASGGGGGGGW